MSLQKPQEEGDCWVLAFPYQHQVVPCRQCPVGWQHLFTAELQERWPLGMAAQTPLYLQLLDPTQWGVEL